jgi:hypothetical protein
LGGGWEVRTIFSEVLPSEPSESEAPAAEPAAPPEEVLPPPANPVPSPADL